MRLDARPPSANTVYNAVGVRVKERPLSGEQALATLNGANDAIAFDVASLRRAEGIGAG